MKKLIFRGVFLIALGIGFNSCKKSNPLNPTQETGILKSYTVETVRGLDKVGSILSFETIDDYVDFVEDTIPHRWQRLEQHSSALGFQNYFTQNPIPSFDDTLGMDENLGKMLNVDGVILIGDYAVRVDAANQKVFLSPKVDIAQHYADLVAGNTSNKNVKEFSTDDDVIDFMITGVNFKCGGVSDLNVEKPWMTVGTNIPLNEVSSAGFNNGDKLSISAKYNKFGIYFSVRINGHYVQNGAPFTGNGLNNLFFEIGAPNSLDHMRLHPRPCNSNGWVIHYRTPTPYRFFAIPSMWNDLTYQLLASKTYKWEGYTRVRGLNKYKIWVRLVVRRPIQGSPGQFTYYTIHQDWIGGQKNI